MKQEYPKVIYNKSGAYVQVESLEKHLPLKDFFNRDYDCKLKLVKLSYVDAMLCLEGAKEETKQEATTRQEEEAKDEKINEAFKISKEKLEATEETKKEGRKAFESIVKNLSSYSWNELRKLGRDIEDSLGVELPLRAKRDIIEKAIINEVLQNDNDKRPNN